MKADALSIVTLLICICMGAIIVGEPDHESSGMTFAEELEIIEPATVEPASASSTTKDEDDNQIDEDEQADHGCRRE